MRTLILFAACVGLCGVAFGDVGTDTLRRVELQKQVREAKLGSHGKIPVKYHEMFGPYQIWRYTLRGSVYTFEARFVKLEKGMVFVGIDGQPLAKTNQPQTELYSIPLKVFDFQAQKAVRDEVQKRLKAERDKKVLYPEPEKKPEPVPEVAKPGAVKEPARYATSYRRINGKLIPVETPVNKAAEEEIRKELEKQALKEKVKSKP